VGDSVIITGENSKDPKQESWVDVLKMDTEYIYFQKYGYHGLQKRKITDVKKNTVHIGADPFKPEIRMGSYQIDIEALFYRCGWDSKEKMERSEKHFGVPVPEICLNPMVIGEDGSEQEYQRGLIWTLLQKQLLIESVYNNVEIGKFVFRKRSYDWVEARMNAKKYEHTAFADLVDGKQRFTALMEFFSDKFPDMSGNYFSDLSNAAQRHFKNYRHLTFVQLDEKASDKDTLATFLAINFSGVPMSIDHINYVKSIKV
jgi:hypothetical protein